MITNVGKQSEFYCMNKHERPIKMIIKEGNNQFYACPKYMLKDDKHPDGYDPELETACSNRISFDDAANIIMKFSEIMEESLLNGEVTDWTNYEFTVKRIKVKILRYDLKHIEFGVINKRTVQ